MSFNNVWPRFGPYMLLGTLHTHIQMIRANSISTVFGYRVTVNTPYVFIENVAGISSGYLVMNPANCGYPQSASLLPVDHDFIIAHHVRVNVWYMWFQYNIVNCKVAIIWFILCQRLQPVSGTVKGGKKRDCGEVSCVWVDLFCCKELLRHLYKLFNLNPHFEIQQTFHVGNRSWERCSLRARMEQQCHYNILTGAFSESVTELNNENAFTQQIHSLLKQERNVEWK